MTTETTETDKIAILNDMLRQSQLTGQVELSKGIQALSKDQQKDILQGVKNFDSFAPQGDSQLERDFGAFSYGDIDIFWEINCYAKDGVWTCFDTDDPAKTDRKLHISLMKKRAKEEQTG